LEEFKTATWQLLAVRDRVSDDGWWESQKLRALGMSAGRVEVGWKRLQEKVDRYVPKRVDTDVAVRVRWEHLIEEVLGDAGLRGGAGDREESQGRLIPESVAPAGSGSGDWKRGLRREGYGRRSSRAE
jgi:hypothetical protein